MFRFSRLITQTLGLVLGLVGFANIGCASSIASRHSHLERRAVCLLDPNIEKDATEWIYDENNNPISNWHPEVLDRVAPTARTVFEYEPGADPRNTRYLPAPYNELTCPVRFSMLPSRDAETAPLPEASLDLLLHEARPEPAPFAVAAKLTSCPSPSSGRLEPIEYTMTFNVYVTDDGQAISAVVAKSTLGDRKTEACMVNALRTTSWPVVAASAPSVAAAPAALKLFVADGPGNLPNLKDLLTEIQRGTPSVAPPQGKPEGVRLPTYIVTLPLRAIVGAGIGVTIFLLPREMAPPWMSELNPITRRPYTSVEEYEAIKQLTQQQIQQAQIKNAQPQAQPAPTPSPQPQPQPAPQEQPDCPRNARFIPERTDNATGCYTKKGDLQCYSRRHHPCAGVHTHGIFTYQKMRGGKCVEIEEPDAVRCEGPFKITGLCGSVSTTTCGEEGTATSGIYRKGKRLDTP